MAEHGIQNSRWTVIEYKGNGTWLCECSCKKHTRKNVKGTTLRNGHSMSCGCITSENTIQRNKDKHKTNQYDLSGEYGIGYCSNTGTPFYFDLEDYDLIKDYCWCECVDDKNYHSLEAYNCKTKKSIRMHHLFDMKGCDHKDRNPLNNRRENLRKCTRNQNAINKAPQVTNTSGISGVTWCKSFNKWRARVTVDGTRVSLGLFTNKDEAVVARLKAEQKYYGEFAPQQHLYEQYGITTNKEN